MAAQDRAKLLAVVIELIGERAMGFVVLDRRVGADSGFEDRRQIEFSDLGAGDLRSAGRLLDRALHLGAGLGPQVGTHQRNARRQLCCAVDAQIPHGKSGGGECHVGNSGAEKSHRVERPGIAFHADGRQQTE